MEDGRGERDKVHSSTTCMESEVLLGVIHIRDRVQATVCLPDPKHGFLKSMME
jgi:hypothetical protein